MTSFHPNQSPSASEQRTGRMLKTCYQAKQLPALLEALHGKKVSGILQLETTIDDRIRKTLLSLNQGELVYGGKLLTTQEIVALLKRNLGGEWTSLAIEATLQQSGDRVTPDLLLSRLVTMRLLSWEQVTAMCLSQIAIAIEPFLAHPGQFSLISQAQPPVVRGFSPSQAIEAIRQRQSLWTSLAPHIPSMDAIPHLSAEALQLIAARKEELDNPANSLLLQLLTWVDHRSAIVEIALEQDKDPLLVARELLPAFQKGWLITKQELPKTVRQQPTILVVDDSDLMRQLIGRILDRQYGVLYASTAMEALKYLDKQTVDLMLLDVSMPGIDGLELCRSIRNMSKFRNLPIVMVTARDGFFDKVKGRLAGATDYLTKPFENEQLLQIVKQYLLVRPSLSQ